MRHDLIDAAQNVLDQLVKLKHARQRDCRVEQRLREGVLLMLGILNALKLSHVSDRDQERGLSRELKRLDGHQPEAIRTVIGLKADLVVVQITLSIQCCQQIGLIGDIQGHFQRIVIGRDLISPAKDGRKQWIDVEDDAGGGDDHHRNRQRIKYGVELALALSNGRFDLLAALDFRLKLMIDLHQFGGALATRVSSVY